MDFDFLPNLPKADLDDRTYQDLVEECLLRLPRYCPEWTNYNPSDPGITLLELFAWLTDQMLLRFNQVPRRNYVAFLELLGVQLQAPNPARTAVTFYLSRELIDPYRIAAGTEVATERTETQEAIVFSTDRPLVVGTPHLQHFLTAETAEETPEILRDRFANLWTQRPDGHWEGPELSVFSDRPKPGNCFYLVFDPDDDIDGNVIALTVQGEEATPTGINPAAPPRRWEAWTGRRWEPVLLTESDDGTQGYSFSALARQGGNPTQGADVVLHLPQQLPVTQFITYQGRWLRCVYTEPRAQQPAYSRSPRIIGLGARAIGGTVAVSQSAHIEQELLGVSDGTPGQAFQLSNVPILARRSEERIAVVSNGQTEYWTEVKDFGASGPSDRHYRLDALTGQIQFGPLIREPAQISQETALRSRIQTESRADYDSTVSTEPVSQLEHQYGAIPPRGATLKMTAYRTGGGTRGNVQPGAIQVVKSAVPYVASIVNHSAARYGSDAESLEQAVMRVPKMLRTRDRAVTPEDFEVLTRQAAQGAVARVRCLPAEREGAGTVRLVVLPQVNLDAVDWQQGIDPAQLSLNLTLKRQITANLAERKLLGVQVALQEPDYVGVSVQTEVALEPNSPPQAADDLLDQLHRALYRFLNPITGGPEGNGWEFGRPLYPSDVISLFQAVPGVRYLGAVQLFELRRHNGRWIRNLPSDPVIDPGPLGLICSWSSPSLRSGHVINVIQRL